MGSVLREDKISKLNGFRSPQVSHVHIHLHIHQARCNSNNRNRMKHSNVNPAGFPRKENTSTRLRKGRSTKHAPSFDENNKQKVSKWSQFAKDVQNPIVTVKWGKVEGRNSSGVDGNMMSLSPGPSDSNLYSQPQISSKGTMQPRSEVRPAPSRNLGGTQTTSVAQNNPNKENRQDSEDYWAFTPTAAGNKLRGDL